MLLTEPEAKQKWCPHYRSTGDCDNRQMTLPGVFCIASACMAWRWQSDGSLNKPTRVHPSVLATHWQGWRVTDPTPDANGFVEISPPASKAERGYCGIAGKPEA